MDKYVLVLDDNLLNEYFLFYRETHPKARKRPIDKPWHPSVNEWMIMKRPQMNMLKQKWKEFGIWWINKLGYENFKLDFFEIDMRIYFDTKRRHDPDNYVAKFLHDGFTESGFLMDDDGEHLKALTIHTDYDKEHPRTEIVVRRIKG